MQQLVVTCALIAQEGKYLLTQRPLDKHNGGRWEFPGGKIDVGEDPQDCLIREVREELGIKISIDEIFGCSSMVYDNERHVLLLCYQSNYVSGDIVFHEVADIAWVTPEEMEEYDITEADLLFVEKLQN